MAEANGLQSVGVQEGKVDCPVWTLLPRDQISATGPIRGPSGMLQGCTEKPVRTQ